MTEERKKKISEAKKGKPSWNKGKTCKKYVNYTDGVHRVHVYEGETPPEGYYKGVPKQEKKPKEYYTDIIEKRRETTLSRHGSSTYNNMEKNRQTKLDRYGDENYNNRDAASETCLEKYGVDNASKVKETIEKIHKTKLERYGTVTPFTNREILDKAIDNAWSDRARALRISTCMAIYGVPYAAMSKDVQDKMEKTFLERYGVNNGFQLPRCGKKSSDSKPNLAFAELLDKNGIEFVREFPLGRKIYDFKIGNILVEINPTATHNSTMNIFDREPLDKDYHYNKSLLAFENGYRCIHVFDWDNVDLIINQLKKRETVYARNCELKEVDSSIAREYLNTYHLQGFCKSDINIGLFNNGELVSIMTFGYPRYNKHYQYELLRLCSHKHVIGGSEKMFKYFLDNYSPKSIISYCDFGKFNGDVYKKLGFSYKGISVGKHWYNIFTGKHITDNLLRQLGADKLIGTNFGKGTDNESILIANYFLEVFDAGQQTYIFEN